MDNSRWMHEALSEARLAATKGEVPVGAVVVMGNEIIARAHNEVEMRHDATAHAEILAMQRASAVLGNWRLDRISQTRSDCEGPEIRLYVTLEPCTMCIGAMVLARLGKLVFGARDLRQGAVGSIFDLSSHSDLPHCVEVVEGVLSEECSRLLSGFFAKSRK